MARNKYQKLILDIVSTRPIAFNPILAHALGCVKAGLFLSQLLFWWEKGDDPEWVYKTIEEIRKETALSRREQETAIRICKKYDLIETKLKRIPAKRHFKVKVENIVSFLKNYSETEDYQKNKISLRKRAKQDSWTSLFNLGD